ncbi:integral membrane protein [Stachybotrys elegans]|uniref:Integral membrane protein n=1 Tax=Stachybotrys elegans TaxID=80388 RepID=A0A8K0SF81_9HYPO|nr:integral membrane protein [Stachybotrys elegans]
MSWVRNAADGVETDGPLITGVAAAMSAIAFSLVVCRMHIRINLIRAFGHDDWLIVVALIGALGYAISSIIQTTWGLGLRHLDDMPPQNLIPFGMVQYIGAPFYLVGLWGFKMSLLLSYMRFVPRPYYIASVTVAVMITMAHIAFMGCFLFICLPVAMQWDPSVVGSCADPVTFYLTFSALTLMFDIIVMALPFPVLLMSQIQKRKKIILLVLFGLGIFTTVIQVIRIQTIRNLANYLDSARSITWSVVEVCVGIIIACVPTLSPMIKYYRDKSRNGTNSGYAHQVGSRYAMQSWKSGKNASRMTGSHIDRENGIQTTVVASDGDSTDNILESHGIMKTTDVKVTRG